MRILFWRRQHNVQLICWIKSNLPEQSRKLTEVYISITRLTLPQTTLFVHPRLDFWLRMHVLPVLLLAYEAKVLLLHQSAIWRMAVWSICAANLLAKENAESFRQDFYFQFFGLCTLDQFYWMERYSRFELPLTAWKAAVLPLHQYRIFTELSASTTNPLVYDSEHRRGAPLLLMLMPSDVGALHEASNRILIYYARSQICLNRVMSQAYGHSCRCLAFV